MIDSITFKTELSEIITVEEVAALFDSIRRKYEIELVSLSLFPNFNQLRKEVIEKTIKQRNKELSKLLSEINNRKQDIKINIWKTLSAIGSNKKVIQNNPEREIDLEQIIYEEEQIINVYENSIRTLDNKEKKIMNGKYPRVESVKISRRKTLKKQLEDLKDSISSISVKHDCCFNDYISRLEEIIDGAIISSKTVFPTSIKAEQYANSQSITIDTDDIDDKKMHYVRSQETKEYYMYEPNNEDLDDELIYQLLAQGTYDEDGTINELVISNEFLEFEEV